MITSQWPGTGAMTQPRDGRGRWGVQRETESSTSDFVFAWVTKATPLLDVLQMMPLTRITASGIRLVTIFTPTENIKLLKGTNTQHSEHIGQNLSN